MLLRVVLEIKWVVVRVCVQHSPCAGARIVVVKGCGYDDCSGTQHVISVWPGMRNARQPCCELFFSFTSCTYEPYFLGFWAAALKISVGSDKRIALHIRCEGQLKFAGTLLVKCLFPFPDDEPKCAVRGILEDEVIDQQVVGSLIFAVNSTDGHPDGRAVCGVTYILELRTWFRIEFFRNFQFVLNISWILPLILSDAGGVAE